MPNLSPVIGLVTIVLIFGIPIIAIVSHYIHETLKVWMVTGLKRDMIARGYTAQEIIEVIAAERDSKTKSFLPNVPPAKPVQQPSYSR